jgi:hypothetical protein
MRPSSSVLDTSGKVMMGFSARDGILYDTNRPTPLSDEHPSRTREDNRPWDIEPSRHLDYLVRNSLWLSGHFSRATYDEVTPESEILYHAVDQSYEERDADDEEYFFHSREYTRVQKCTN